MSVDDSRGRRYRAADLSIDTATGEVRRDGVALDLPPLSYRLLLALAMRAPALLSHEDLLAQVWRGRCVSPETITQRIKLLRQAIGDDAANPRFVGLVRGQGYRMLPEVTVESVAGPAVEARAPATHGRGIRRLLPVVRLSLAPAAAAVLILALFPRDPGADITPSADPIWTMAGEPLDGDSPSKASIEAETFLEKGTFFYQRRAPGDIERAKDNFQHALRIDPDHAPAWVGLSAVYQLSLQIGVSSDPEGDSQRRRHALQRALELDPEAGHAHARFAQLMFGEGQREEAWNTIRHAVAVAPEDPQVLNIYSGFLEREGEFLAAAEVLLQAIRLDPLSSLNYANAGSYLLKAGRPAMAESVFRALQALRPASEGADFGLATALLLQGRPSEALQLVRPLEGTAEVRVVEAIALHRLGRIEEHRQVLKQLGQQSPAEEMLVYSAEVRAAAGEQGAAEFALQRLEQVFLDRPQRKRVVYRALNLLHHSPFLDSPLNLLEMHARLLALQEGRG
jgi:Tfp pilus assembly protein PilF/DNA-binding winged helix-turn-helix (wHTH) protein